jgi:transposase
MSSVPVFVGLDYHAKSVQVCVMDGEGRQLVNRRCGNSVAEITRAVGAVPERAAIESCCGAADLAEALITEAHWPIRLAHAGYVARMKHNPDKSDYSDAKMLAELCRAGLIPPVWLPSQDVRGLRMLVRLRADLVARRRAVKTRILGVLRAQRIVEPKPGRWSKLWLAWLRDAALCDDATFVVSLHLFELDRLGEQCRQVESRLEERMADDAIVARLRSIKGVGPVTAWTMRALIGRFDRFVSGKQLSRFCAVTPRNASSGGRVADAGLIRAGDPLLKTVLIETAHRLRRYDPRWSAFSHRLEERGKPVSVAVAAVANRWTRWLFHQLKEIEPMTRAA